MRHKQFNLWSICPPINIIFVFPYKTLFVAWHRESGLPWATRKQLTHLGDVTDTHPLPPTNPDNCVFVCPFIVQRFIMAKKFHGIDQITGKWLFFWHQFVIQNITQYIGVSASRIRAQNHFAFINIKAFKNLVSQAPSH